jgi:Spy/CpxP family protein refolding chaperone
MMAWWKWKQAAHAGHGPHGHGPHGHGPHEHGGHGPGGGCGPSGGCGPGGGDGGGGGEAFASGDSFDGDYGGGNFGVRRPLRFLAHKLELDDKQVEELAHVLNELKTERAQAAVDHRRTVAGFADVIAAETFDEAKVGAVAADRVKSAERLRDALVKALGQIHALLRKEQRGRFAYLIRTGALSL